jgi:magnesium chelatase family protein
MNPCPCGYAGDERGRCRCSLEKIARYRDRISGPLMDRIDIHVELAALPAEHLVSDIRNGAECSSVVAARVAAARAAQLARQGKLNARLTPAEVAQFCLIGTQSRALLTKAISRWGLSARAYHGALKLARTAADLAGVAQIRVNDVAEAVKLRALDRAIC